MPIAEIVADANVLLSAVVGRAALRVFTQFGLRVHATQFNVEEILRYFPRMAVKYRLPLELVELQWRLLAVMVHPDEQYAEHFSAARQALEQRDPEDAHALALAWTLGLPLWSNDRDFEGCAVQRYTTAELLRLLEQEHSE
jgi:predicted nucleic acid-binding protein